MRTFVSCVLCFGVVSSGCDSSASSESDAGETVADAGGTMVDAGEPAADAGETNRCGDGLTLPGDAFYPEGIALGPDGEIAVTSVATGHIVRFLAGQTRDPETLVAPGGDVVNGVGIRYDADAGLYWVCSNDLSGASVPALLGIDPEDGSTEVRHTFPAGSFCNDILVTPNNDVYVSDSFAHRIWSVAAGARRTADSLAVLSEESAFGEGANAGDFTLNGMALDGDALYVVRSSTGQLWRVPIAGDGTAEAAVEIDLGDADLVNADGLVLEAPGQLLVLSNFSGEVERVTISGDSGTVTAVATGLDLPASGLLTGDGDLLVTLTQFDHLFMSETAGAPELPFCVGRVEL